MCFGVFVFFVVVLFCLFAFSPFLSLLLTQQPVLPSMLIPICPGSQTQTPTWARKLMNPSYGSETTGSGEASEDLESTRPTSNSQSCCNKTLSQPNRTPMPCGSGPVTSHVWPLSVRSWVRADVLFSDLWSSGKSRCLGIVCVWIVVSFPSRAFENNDCASSDPPWVIIGSVR